MVAMIIAAATANAIIIPSLPVAVPLPVINGALKFPEIIWYMILGLVKMELCSSTMTVDSDKGRTVLPFLQYLKH
jgi:hypothetical protein